jgi:hypothetical protein
MSTTTNLALNEPAYNSTSPTWDQPLNYNSTILDQMFGATTSVAVNTGPSGYTTITAPSAVAAGQTSQAMRFNLTGSIIANQLVLLPYGVAGMWVVSNNTTGSYTVTMGSNNGSNAAAGTTVTVQQGANTIIFSDGTNVAYSDSGIVNQNPSYTSITATTGTLTVTGNISPTGRITPRVNSTSSVTSPLAWNSNSYDEYAITAQASSLTISADAGSPVNGQTMIFRIQDNGTAQALTWTQSGVGSFRPIGVFLPSTTTANKVTYVGCIYNSYSSYWDVVAVTTQF